MLAKYTTHVRILCFLSIILLGASKTTFSQIWNPSHAVGTVTGKYHYAYNQAADQLIEIYPAGFPSTGQSYQWQSSPTPNEADFTPVANGGTSSYSPGAVTATMYYRRKTTNIFLQSIYSNIVKIALVSNNWEDRNYIREHTVQVTGVTTWQAVDQLPIGQKLQSTTYMDGLGRSVQNISRETATPSQAGGLWGDVVQFSQYDAMGRQTQAFLPYSTTTESGKYKTAPGNEQPQYYTNVYNETSAFSTINFETNPLQRIGNIKDAGTKWTQSGGMSVEYDVNSADDNVRIFGVDYVQGNPPVYKGVYPANSLYKKSYIDKTEAVEKKVVEYTDKAGKIILKKIQLDDAPSAAHSGWICTYSIYDDVGLLRYQLQPEAVKYLDENSWSFAGVNGQKVLNELCYQYYYDDKGRTTWKKGPGAAPMNMLYDARDRIVFTQDGNQAALASPQWTVNLYDELDRTVITALYNTSKTITALQADINNAATTSSTTIANPGQVVGDLMVNKRDAAISRYAATNSIEFVSDANGSFESLSNDEFVAEIDPNATQSYNVTTVTYKNPVSATDLGNQAVTTILKYEFYDDYSFAAARPFNSSFTNLSAYSTSDPNVLPIALSMRLIDMPTGSMTRVLGTNTFLTTTQYYDDKGLPVQILADNIKTGTDITTRQYHFDGRILSTCFDHTAPGTGISNFVTLNKYNFDKLGRVTSIQKQLGANPFKTILSNDYDDMGRVKAKHLDPDYASPSGGTGLETLNYSFNLHNQLTGINKDYALKNPSNYNKWEHFFGMYLGFDNRDNIFTKSRLNGQVGGVLWNTQGDDAQRKYDYSYDNAGRLVNAAFTEQQHPGDGWLNNKMDFSVNGTNGKVTYDLNGNLVNMLQKGVQPGNASPITVDNLTYAYSLSNKLQSVTDQMTVPAVNGQFGDFKDGSNGASADYVYDGNGNVVIDLNKNAKELGNVPGANGIKYNHLDKPEQIRIVGKGTINITYSADGETLKRVYTPDSGPAVTTTYAGDYIYRATGTNSESLAYINFEEGRIRVIQSVSQITTYDGLSIDGNMSLPNGKAGVYDYFIRDYQQNVRMVLTEETHNAYNTCTMEAGRAATEEPVFGQTGGGNEVATTRYPAPSSWQNSDIGSSVSQLGNIAGRNIGPNTLQKVMAGDKVSASVLYFYQNATGGGNPNLVSNLLSSLGQAITGSPAASQVVKGNAAGITSGLNGTTGFLTAVQPAGSGGNTPKAYLTILFFDERFKFIEAADGGVAQQQVLSSVGSNGLSLALGNIKAPKNGYAYVYVSNESDQDVYFDKLQVGVVHGNIIEENHYYAFGLKISSISSNKPANENEGLLKNNHLYNDKELFDDADLNWYDYGFRNYDAQIGRFVQIDPVSDYMPALSTYHYAYNDPVTNIDADGLVGIPCPGTSSLSIFLSNVGSAISNALSAASPVISAISPAINVTITTLRVEEGIQASNMINGQVTVLHVGLSSEPIPTEVNRPGVDRSLGTSKVSRYGRLYEPYKGRQPGTGWRWLWRVVRVVGTNPVLGTAGLVLLPSNAFDDPNKHPENTWLIEKFTELEEAEKDKEEDEYERKNPKNWVRYVTYIKIKINDDGTYQVYSGRTSGPATMTAEQIVAARDKRHQANGKGPKEGYEDAVVDKEALANEKNPNGKYAIRGREQQLIDHFGGAQMDFSNYPDGGTSANKYRGVSRYNLRRKTYHRAANLKWGELHKFTGLK